MIDLVPYVEVNGTRTVSDGLLRQTFEKIKEDGSHISVFSEGGVKTPDDFIKMMKSPQNLPVFVLVDKKISGLAWINGCVENRAFGHFCFFKEVWGTRSLEMGKAVLKYWFSFPGNDGPLFDIILGMTPGGNKKALGFITRLGFERVGEIPKMSRNAYTGDRDSIVLSYYMRA